MSRAIPLFLGMVYSIIIFILYTEGLNTYSCFIISDVIEVKKVGSNLVFLPSPPPRFLIHKVYGGTLLRVDYPFVLITILFYFTYIPVLSNCGHYLRKEYIHERVPNKLPSCCITGILWLLLIVIGCYLTCDNQLRD